VDWGDGQGLPGAGLLPQRTTLTDGVIALRAPSLDDVEDYARSATDPTIIDFTHVPLDFGRDGATRFVVGACDEWEAGTKARFAVCRADSMSRLLGSISLVNIVWPNLSAELGYWVLPEARGQRYAMRAVRLVQRWAFDVVGLARIEAQVFDGNEASWHILETCGFRVVAHQVVEHRGKNRGERLLQLGRDEWRH